MNWFFPLNFQNSLCVRVFNILLCRPLQWMANIFVHCELIWFIYQLYRKIYLIFIDNGSLSASYFLLQNYSPSTGFGSFSSVFLFICPCIIYLKWILFETRKLPTSIRKCFISKGYFCRKSDVFQILTFDFLPSTLLLLLSLVCERNNVFCFSLDSFVMNLVIA